MDCTTLFNHRSRRNVEIVLSMLMSRRRRLTLLSKTKKFRQISTSTQLQQHIQNLTKEERTHWYANKQRECVRGLRYGYYVQVSYDIIYWGYSTFTKQSLLDSNENICICFLFGKIISYALLSLNWKILTGQD